MGLVSGDQAGDADGRSVLEETFVPGEAIETAVETVSKTA